MSWPCSWWEQTGRMSKTLGARCDCGHITRLDLGMIRRDVDWSDTAQWPESCEECGHVFDFDGEDHLARFTIGSPEYCCPASGAVCMGGELPIGALYDCGYGSTGLDGRSIVCVIPGAQTVVGQAEGRHHWHIDMRATNCTMPDDTKHRCWVRHGDPRKPHTVHVDKNGDTCAAGAGSISVKGYHGFLHDGHVTDPT